MGKFIDEHVGKRIRQRRLLLGVSEKSLGQAVSCTVLEVKRYEMGIDRVEASALFKMAEALDVPVTYFFEGLKLDSTEQQPDEETRALKGDATELIAAYHSVPKNKRREVFEKVAAKDMPGLDKLN